MSLGPLPGLLLLPPMNCLVLAAAGAAWRRRAGGPPMLAAGLAGLWFFAMPVTGRDLLVSLESGLDHPAAPVTPPQAIVILSGDQQEFLGEGEAVGPLTIERDRAGAALARATHLPVLVTGGRITAWAPPLADQMARDLQTNFATAVTWRETASLDTWENAVKSAAILRANNISSIYLVTHAWHMRRALLAFRQAGLDATPAPVGLDAPERIRPASFLPQPHAWLQSYWAIHEWLGCAWYTLRG
jgi:uncharacterized SAM-binding protein YcdF (DUF218 family)